jgi:hypothetical protein
MWTGKDGPVIPAERLIAILKYRGMDGEALMVAQRKSLQAFIDASGLVAKGMEAIAQRNATLVRDAVGRVAERLPELARQRTLDEVARMNLDNSRDDLAAEVQGFQEMAELVWKCNRDAFDLINRSLVESLENFVKASPPATSAAPAASAEHQADELSMRRESR